MELDSHSTDTSMELGSSDPTFSLQSRRHSYLEKIRSLPVVSAGGWSSSLSSSSRSARSSSYYSSSKSSSAAGGSRHRYVPYSNSPRRVQVRLEDKGPRDIARRMVRDGFMGRLIGEFGRAPVSALERWFSELDVGWVLRSALEKEKSELALDLAVQRWTRGFTVMAEALSATQRYLQEEGSTVEGPAVFMELPTTAGQVDRDDLRLVRFVEATICKMLAFANSLVAVADKTWNPMNKFSGLMNVRSCISHVSEIIMLSLKKETLWLPDSDEMKGLLNKTSNIFSTTNDNLGQAIQRMTNDAQAVTPVLSGMRSWETLPQSAEIHNATHLIMGYARLFWGHIDELNSILGQSWPHRILKCDIIEQMISNLIDHLEKKSESFSDPSLRYLFLLNNSYSIQYQYLAITGYSLPSDSKIGIKYCYYRNCYLNVSWDTVLSCLHIKMPTLWFSKTSHLARFKSEFQRTCRHQKLWKVPNPELRKSLRKAIIDKVTTGPTGYKTYLEAHPEQEKCGSNQQDMEDMVNELFEG
uniref:Exocyst subunit Exo70 family protein n=1 Tax=Oryza punctata TaxID=4537 RepID=A0A0E0L1Q9_ORYPU